MKQRIFVSSVQKEFSAERRALKTLVETDPLLSRFFDVFIFEDIPATDLRADAVYLDQVRECRVYLGLFGNQYGWEDKNGVSPTEREFQEATRLGKQRLVFIKRAEDGGRCPKMLALIIEKYGTGTLMMIRESVNHALPEPDFAQHGGEFVTTIWRDWLTEKVMSGLDLNDRQRTAVAHVKAAGRITNSEYRQLTSALRKTAAGDLDDLVAKGVLERRGERRGVHYVLKRK